MVRQDIRHYLLKIIVPMVIGASLVFGAVTLAGAIQGTIQDRVQVNHPLLVNTRKDLAICVSSDNRSDVGAVHRAIESDIKSHRLWAPVFGSYAVRVDFGCPSDPYLVKFPEAKSELVIPSVRTASMYRTFVHVMPESQLTALVGDTGRRVWPQEALCVGHDCSTVTTEVYVTPSEARTPTFLGSELLKAIGLENPYPVPPSLPRVDKAKRAN